MLPISGDTVDLLIVIASSIGQLKTGFKLNHNFQVVCNPSRSSSAGVVLVTIQNRYNAEYFYFTGWLFKNLAENDFF